MNGRKIAWWTTRVRRTSKSWTTFPVIVLRRDVGTRRGGFVHVLGLIGRYKGEEFSVVESEVTSYPPTYAALAVGAKKYLTEYHAKLYAGKTGLDVTGISAFHRTTKKTRNDPSARAERDPETRRKIRSLELRIRETTDVYTVQKLLRQLLALYQELGDARGVIRCKSDLSRVNEFIRLTALRKQRHKHRAARGAKQRPLRRGQPWAKSGPLPANVLWAKDDLALIALPVGEVLLVQLKSWGPTPIRRFVTEELAIAWLKRKLGAAFTGLHDPDRKKRRKR